MINCYSTEPHGLSTANQTSNVFDDEQVQFILSQQLQNLGEFRSVETLPFSARSNGAIVNFPFVVFGDNLLGMVNLILEAPFLLVRTATNSRHDANNEQMTVAWSDRRFFSPSKHVSEPSLVTEGRGRID